jgi:poly[(R)-3-hydroxyalkanoate] polymerase subunit PhaC
MSAEPEQGRARPSREDEGPERERAERASEALGPEAGLIDLDPLAFGSAVFGAWRRLALHPLLALKPTARLATGLVEAGAATFARALGAATNGPVAPAEQDRRFRDPAWMSNAWFFGLLQTYLLGTRFLAEIVDKASEDGERDKAAFATQLATDALAPTNFLATNPAALRRAFDTGGLSLRRGLLNVIRDVATNAGLPRKVDPKAFDVGRNLAVTPGKVVFRNRLMELIQYAPQTDRVFQTPLLLSPPWINKYYIMDLSPGRSFAEWAVQHGHTVFAISYRNPDESMRNLRLDDYLLDGPRAALDAVTEITGESQVNVVGLCVGGTLTPMLIAYLDAIGDRRVNSATLLNTLLDFSEPGVLGNFADRASIERLERRMSKRGYLTARDMARTFDLLRANDLIWSYVASSWLMGDDPPAFDILAWNDDGMRMPARMHSFYLRSCYLNNEFARGKLELAGEELRLDTITQDVYLVGAREDHIAPWRSSYKATQLLGGKVRFVLTSSGHVAGIVNPPGPKARFWTNPELPGDPDAWFAAAEEQQESWWVDWAAWIETRAGKKQTPPPLGSDAHPPLDEAPGTYVRQPVRA